MKKNIMVNILSKKKGGGLLESLPGGSYSFISQGIIVMQTIQTPAGQQQRINDDRAFEGWKHEFDSINTER